MTRNEIIEQVSKESIYIDYCKRVCGGRDIYKDLFQFIILSLMEIEEEKLIGINERGKLKGYIVRMIYINANSKTSPFYREITGFEFVDTEFNYDVSYTESDEETEIALNNFDEELKKECNKCEQRGVYPSAIKIYELYEQKGSYTEVSKCTQIPYKTILRYVHKTREKILNNLNDKNINGNTAE